MRKIQFHPDAGGRTIRRAAGTVGLLYGRRENSWNYCAFYIKQFTSGVLHSYLLTALMTYYLPLWSVTRYHDVITIASSVIPRPALREKFFETPA